DNRVVLKPEYEGVAVQDNFFVVRRWNHLGLLTRDGRVISACRNMYVQIADDFYETSSWHDVGHRKEETVGPFAVTTFGLPGGGWSHEIFRLDGTPALGEGFVFDRAIRGKYIAAMRVADRKVRVFDLQGNDVGGRDFHEVDGSRKFPFIIARVSTAQMLYDDDFKRVSQLEFNAIGVFSEGLCPVRIGSRWGFIDLTGALAIPAEFAGVSHFSEGLCAAGARLPPGNEMDAGKSTNFGSQDWSETPKGYIDASGKFVVAPKYSIAGDFRGGIAKVSTSPAGTKDVAYKYIDKTGAEITPDKDRLNPPKQLCEAVSLTNDKDLIWSATGNLICRKVWSAEYDRTMRLVVYGKSGNHGIVNPESGYVGPMFFEEIKPLSAQLVIAKDYRGWIIMDRNGLQIGDMYGAVGILTEGRASVRQFSARKYGYVDERGEVVIEPKYLDGQPFSEGVAAVSDGSWGFIDKKGDWVVRPKYEGADPFRGGLASVKLGGKWGVIDSTGQVVIPFGYEAPVRFDGDVAPAKVKTLYGCIDCKGSVVIEPRFDYMGSFSDDLAVVQVGELRGAIDGRGDFAIEPKYALLERLGEGILAYSLPPFPTRMGLMKSSGEIICEPMFDGLKRLGEGRYAARRNGVQDAIWGLIDAYGRWIATPAFIDIAEFSEGLAAAEVTTGGERLWGFIDKAGMLLIPPVFQSVGSFCEGFASFRAGQFHGFIDRQGNVIIQPKYDSVSDFHRGVAAVRVGIPPSFLINPRDEVVSPGGIAIGGPVPNGYIAHPVEPRDGGEIAYGVVDEKGKFIIDPSFEWLAAPDGRYPLSGKKDGKRCLVDETGNTTDLESDAGSLTSFSAGYASYFVPGVGTRFIDRTGRVVFTWPFTVWGFSEVRVPPHAVGKRR
ncbi:MAG: WG repeat-containing protein, partial [Candidatus Brocadiia bacterium]